MKYHKNSSIQLYFNEIDLIRQSVAKQSIHRGSERHTKPWKRKALFLKQIPKTYTLQTWDSNFFMMTFKKWFVQATKIHEERLINAFN